MIDASPTTPGFVFRLGDYFPQAQPAERTFCFCVEWVRNTSAVRLNACVRQPRVFNFANGADPDVQAAFPLFHLLLEYHGGAR